MSLLGALLILAVIGLGTWAITTYVPMPAAFRRLIIAVAVIGALLWVLQLAGLVPALGAIRFPHR